MLFIDRRHGLSELGLKSTKNVIEKIFKIFDRPCIKLTVFV